MQSRTRPSCLQPPTHWPWPSFGASHVLTISHRTITRAERMDKARIDKLRAAAADTWVDGHSEAETRIGFVDK